MIVSSMRFKNSGRNRCLQGLFDRRANFLFAAVLAGDLLDHLAADVRGHHDDRVGEIDRVTLVVGQSAVVEHLQQDVEHVAMGLFDFVQQHDRIGPAADGFGEPARLLRSRRSPAERRSSGSRCAVP